MGPWRVISLEPKGRRDGGALKSSSARKNTAWVGVELSLEPGGVADDGAFKSSSGRENPAWVVVELSRKHVEVGGGEAGSTGSSGSGALLTAGLGELSLVAAPSISLSLSTGAGRADGEE